jgi:hypothetical protein
MAGRTTATNSKSIKIRSAAKATSRVKTTKKAIVTDSVETATVPKTTRRRVKAETRTRVYWAVFNPDLKRVAVFEFDQKAEAEKRASKLTQSSGGPHFIQKIKAVVQS